MSSALSHERVAPLRLAGRPRRPSPHRLKTFRRAALLLDFAESEFAGYGAAFVSGLDQDGGVGQSGFLDFERNFSGPGSSGDGLGVEGRGVGTGKAEG